MIELKPGTVVTPSVRLVRRLGAGGMGSVWVADHLALRTQVVVKFMSAELAASGAAVERFSREAAAAAQVKSPHVVQMLDHGITPDGVPFIAMELLEGRDLADHLYARKRLSLAETSSIIAQVAKALARAHERGIVHRDIKPENIFLSEVGGGETFVKLLDFGIAKGHGCIGLSNGTKTGAPVGTPYYMSPEQIVGAKDVDLRTDLWSLGVVAYECVVGQRAFEAENFGALAVLIHSTPPPVPSVADPNIPPAFDAWFAKACAPDPARRFASARELADGIAQVASRAPLPVGPAVAISLPFEETGLPGEPVDLVSRPSTHAGVGVGLRPSGGSSAGWIVAAIAAVALLAVGGAIVARRLPSASASSGATLAESAIVPLSPAGDGLAASILPKAPVGELSPAPSVDGLEPPLGAPSSRPSDARRKTPPKAVATAQPPSSLSKPTVPRSSAAPPSTAPHEKDIF